MGYDLDRFHELGDFEDELTCAICSCIFEEPAVTPCLHTFCKDCIHQWFQQERTCPVCRKPVDRLCRPPLVLLNFLGKLKMKCDFREKGCSDVLSMDSLQHHLERCPFKPTSVKAQGVRHFVKRLFSSWSQRSPVQDQTRVTGFDEVLTEYDTEHVALRAAPVERPDERRGRTTINDIVGVGVNLVILSVFIFVVIIFSKTVIEAIKFFVDITSFLWFNVGSPLLTFFLKLLGAALAFMIIVGTLSVFGGNRRFLVNNR